MTKVTAAPVAPGPPRAADAVDIVARVERHVVVDHMGNPFDVEPALRDIGRDQHAHVALREALHCAGAMPHLSAPVDHVAGDLRLIEPRLEHVRADLRAGEDQHLVPPGLIEQVHQEVGLPVRPDGVRDLRDPLYP